MFDDQSTSVGSGGIGAPPANLPIGEAEDMFAGAEPAAAPPSAVDAGMLKPKMLSGVMPDAPPIVALAETTVHTPPPEMTQAINNIKEPKTAKRIIFLVLILAGAVVLVGIIWFIFVRLTGFMSAPAASTRPSSTVIQDLSEVPPVGSTPPAQEADVTSPASQDDQTAVNFNDDTILFGKPIDVDGDNLDQSREQTIGTDSNNWDTDGDGLSDGDEVIIWKTDPTNPDTDGDNYTDGSEIKNGYSPTGPGKLFQPPSNGT